MMTNDELKKKTIEIISPYVVERWHEKIADALIAAGIGDVKTVREIGASAAAMAVFEAAKAKHRAEVAERALEKFAENITCEDCPFFSDCASSEKMEDLIHSSYCFAEYLRQAKKELAEERKDD